MNASGEQDFISRIKKIVTDELPLSRLNDDELLEQIEQIVDEQTYGKYFSVNEKVDIIQQIYSSIRGFGLLDSIIADDSITEVMINGPDDVFIEKTAN